MTDLLELGELERRGIENAQRVGLAALDAARAERAESRDSAHALVARAVVQLRTAMSTLRDANHAADPVVHLHLLSILRDLGAVSARVGELENAMAIQGKR